MRIAVLMTAYGRAELVMTSVRAIAAQRADADIDIFLLDDSPQREVANAVAASQLPVRIREGTGELYWAGGMRMLMREVLAGGSHTHVLWLNSDVILGDGAVQSLLSILTAHPDSIAVGAVADDRTGEITYSGLKMLSSRTLKMARVDPAVGLEECDTFNGNVVLMSVGLLEQVGVFPNAYRHGMADYDFGLRAKALGFKILLAPGQPLGTCRANHRAGTYLDASLPLRTRWKMLRSPKGLPLGAWLVYSRRNAGSRWPLLFLRPYAAQFKIELARLRLRAAARRAGPPQCGVKGAS